MLEPGRSAACPRPTQSSGTALDAVSVTGAFDTPTVQLPTPFVTDAVSYDDVETGSGAVIRSDVQTMQATYSIYDGSTGQSVYQGVYSGADATVARWDSGFPGVTAALQCATEGSRVVFALPAGGLTDSVYAAISVDPSASAVLVVDIDRVFLAQADGAPVYNDARDLPTVVRAPDGRPGVIIPDADPPTDVVVQTLLKGSGAAVQADDTVRVNFTGLTWAEKTVFGTSWGSKTSSFTLDQLLPAVGTALTGATVGSQVLIVVPPDQGYGDQGQGALVPPGATLVFVFDILGIDPPAATG